MVKEISNRDDILDVRDMIARVEELQDVDGIEEKINTLVADDDAKELVTLRELLGELAGNGGDEQWRGDWYPITLIRDNYFVEAMRQLVEDIGDFLKGFPSYIEVDWEKTADNLRADYGSVEFNGVTYWYR